MSQPFTVLDQPEVLRVMFYPRRSWPGISLVSNVHDGRVEVEAGVSLGYSLHPALSGMKGLAEPPSPLILYFHGNGEVARDYDSIAPFYTDLGISLLVADYRGYGWSDGLPTASSLVHDAPLVFEALGQILQEAGSEVPPFDRLRTLQRVFVMGRSLGSAAAIEVACHHQEAITGLIIESGFAHTSQLLARLGVVLENLDETQDVFSNLTKISQISLPTLVIHGQADMLIPASEGVALYERSVAPDDEKRLVIIPGAGHNDLLTLGAATYFEAIRDFVLG